MVDDSDVGASGSRLSDDYFRRPSPARVWNYWLGGKDNYPIDREVGDATVTVNPHIPEMARDSRKFLGRAVRHLAGEAGVGQFLDIGTGLPTEQNTHEIAQVVRPDAKIVYVDNDPVVLAHARALLTNTTSGGVTTYLDHDVREPTALLEQARELLDFESPIAVMLLGILGHAAPVYADARAIIDELMSAMPAGSYLTVLDGVDTDPLYREGARRQAELGHPYKLRTEEEFAGFFTGLELVEPGIVAARDWPAADPQTGKQRNVCVGVGRKP
ncbi:MAG TPA: SAM-dependent methyltransferase [Pseudonocardia sp.]|jgi:hypothetical protein|nr:SAM-dependent methyltransferase [Pseudonocardia sp.]